MSGNLRNTISVLGLLATGLISVGCGGDDHGPSRASGPAASFTSTVDLDAVVLEVEKDTFPTRIHLPTTGGQARASGGREATLVCSSCHATRENKSVRPRIEDLTKVHVGLRFTHGTLSCTSCHDQESAYDSFRLADGEIVEYDDVMQLCSQCHASQRSAYDHGAHGGMTGYWDLTRGPRDRNSCPVCHDPHAPEFPKMQPTFKPIDRFLTPIKVTTEDSHGR